MYQLKLLKVEVETADIKVFWFVAQDQHRSLFKFKAGQFIAFKIPVASGAIMRCYSLARAPRSDGTFCIGVRRVEGGLGSNWLHDHLKAGDTILGSVPAGLFTLTSRSTPLKLIAAGSGITPILSIFETALSDSERPISLLYAVSDREKVAFEQTIRDLIARYPDRAGVKYHFDCDASGYLTQPELCEWIGLAEDADIYICGPPAFMDLCAAAAADAGIASSAIHIERFNLPAQRQPSGFAAAEFADKRTSLLIVREGKQESISYNGYLTVLEAMRTAGLSPEASCEEGFCGACRAFKAGGQIELKANHCLSAEDLEAGWILSCQAVVKSEHAEIRFDGPELGSPHGDRSTPLGRRFYDPRAVRTRRIAIVLASMAASIPVAIWIYLSPLHARLLNPGPMMPGHASLDCVSCHQPAPGDTRQQIQAIVASWLGWRHDNPQFGFLPPQNSDCVDCHERANDRHPINRFREPRFLAALDIVDARTCGGCHIEHTGDRVAGNGQYCEACHKDVEVKHDPLELSHANLASQQRWDTCLQCHDFHGNHKHETPRSLAARLDLSAVKNYLKDGADPFGSEKSSKAKQARQ